MKVEILRINSVNIYILVSSRGTWGQIYREEKDVDYIICVEVKRIWKLFYNDFKYFEYFFYT